MAREPGRPRRGAGATGIPVNRPSPDRLPGAAVGLWLLWAVLLFGGFALGSSAGDSAHRMPTWTRMGSSAVLVLAAWTWFAYARRRPGRPAAAGLSSGAHPAADEPAARDRRSFALLVALGMTAGLHIDDKEIAEFSRRWDILEFALFGSVLSDRFGPDSDVDVLVTFAPHVRWNLFDLVDMAAELETMFGRHVDLVEATAIRNPFRRQSITDSKRVIHAA